MGWFATSMFAFTINSSPYGECICGPDYENFASKIPRPQQSKQSVRQDDSLNVKRASDLALRPGGERKGWRARAFVEGMVFEENGEMDSALEAYRKVLKCRSGPVATRRARSGLADTGRRFSTGY